LYWDTEEITPVTVDAEEETLNQKFLPPSSSSRFHSYTALRYTQKYR